MKIVICGAGAVGTHLAELLSREDQDIILIDENPEKTARLTQAGEYDLMTLTQHHLLYAGSCTGSRQDCGAC